MTTGEMFIELMQCSAILLLAFGLLAHMRGARR